MRFVAILLLLAAAALPARADDYPSKPVRIICSTPAGQATDILARLVGNHLSMAFGQQFVVDNRTGAGGIIALETAAKSPADGYTLVMATSGPVGINPGLYRKLPYDVLNDFAPISNLGFVAQTLVVSADSPFKSAQELVAAIKAKPSGFVYGSSGNGSTAHLTTEMLKAQLGLDIVHVPYRGSPPAVLDLIGGSINMMFDAMPGVLGQIRDGKLRPLAVSTRERSSFLPDVPTIGETVAAGFEATGWIGIAAPAKTSPQIIDKLHGEIVKALATAEVQKRMNDLAFTPIGSSPTEFGAFIKSEVAKWTKVVKEAGATVD